MNRIQRILLSTTAAAALCLALAAAPSALAEDGMVTFRNMTGETQHLLVRLGEAKQCSEKGEKIQLEIAAGESADVPAGAGDACFCHSTFGKIGDCGSWNKAKAGKVEKIR